jgi:hypothetical protein
MTDVFTQPDDGGDLKSSDFTTSMVDRLGAQWADTLDPKDSLSGMWLLRRAREGTAGGFMAHDYDVGVDADSAMRLQAIDQQARAAIPDITRSDAQDLLKQEGLSDQDVHLGDAPTHKLPVLKMQIAEAHTRRDRQAAIERGPQGFFPDALGTVTSIGAGMMDPVNAAAFSIPVIGEARMGKIIASAGDSILSRGAARFAEGAAQGAVGTAALQPADWWLHTRDGQDYTMAQAMESVVMGAGMGGAFHAGFGGYRDIRSRIKGLPLEGSPQDLLQRGLISGTHVSADQLAEEGVPIDEVPGISPDVADRFPGDAPQHPADVLADLPPAAKEDAVHAAMADVIAGRPTQAAEMLQVAADHDPRIAESFEAWHGSPHDFDRFDSSKLGTGEGAQSYGHGLYFAENEKVATQYARSTSGRDFIRKAQELYSEHDSPDDAHAEIAASKDFTPGQKRLLLALEKDDWLGFDYPHQAVSAALSDPNGKNWEMSPETLDAIKHVGNMYRVRINAHQDHFLDWDKPLGEHTEPVRSKLRAAGFEDTQTGKDIYHSLVKYRPNQGGGTTSAGMKLSDLDATPEAASGQLKAGGIHGIKYLDQSSRGAGDGTRNYVVFDDKHIEITHKNGEPVKKEDLVAEHQMQRARAKGLRGRAAADPRTWSLFEYLASKGGLKPDPELRAIFGNDRGPFVPGFGPLLRRSGATLDEALTRAKEGGYLIDANDLQHVAHTDLTPTQMGKEATLTPRDLLDHIDDESRGRKVYRPDHEQSTGYDPEQEKHIILGALEHELEASGAKVGDIDPALLDRTVEIVHREGVSDVLEAYERAIMEDAERYDATADERKSIHGTGRIPGWDTVDAATALGNGGVGPEGSRPQGRPNQGPRGTDGQEPSGPRRGDRSSPAVVAADPRWRQLADTTADFNEPDILAESEQAAQTPEPASVNPQKSLSALEKAAADAEEVWRRLEPTLTEDERKSINDAFAAQQVDKDVRARMIVDGVTCLVGAIG